MLCFQGDRVDDLKMILGRVADAATLFDTNGINVRFMNSAVEGNNVRSTAEATSLLGQVRIFKSCIISSKSELALPFMGPLAANARLPACFEGIMHDLPMSYLSSSAWRCLLEKR